MSKKIARDKAATPRLRRAVIRNTRATRRRVTPQPDRLIAKADASAGTHVDSATAEPSSIGFPIVGIGASAGGLDAFAELLSEVPVNTPLALVLVQHLDPTHESALVTLLARTTRMPVVEVKHGTRVEPARVYVIPPNASMTIASGVLNLALRERGSHTMAIDHFLRSLAEDCGGRAIGVILSGTASDGVLGLTAIKGVGGLTFAQDPDSAKYDGMPRSAIACGAVDIVLPAAAIGRELARLATHPYIRQSAPPAPAEASVDGQAFAGIFRILQRETGVDFTDYRQTTVRRRIARRMIVHKLDTVEAYHRHLKEHPAEAPALRSDLLISVTSFFRDADAFRVLQRKVFPRLVKRPAAAPPIRVWVPACATGEEAYSLAIALLEALGPAAGPPLVQIFGTDLSETAITHARAGVYARNIELDVSPERLGRFFVKLDGQYQVSKSVRELCVFAKHDLAQDPPFSRVDVISCRNVLIYLEAKLQKRVMSVLHYALKNEGVLLLGAAETVAGFADLFTVVDRQHRLYRKKATSIRLDGSFTGLGRTVEKREPGQTPDRSAPRPGGEEDLQRQVDRIVLSRYAPAGVLINDAMDILQFRGRTSPYLEPAPGQASLNILKMAREGLLMELRQAIARVRRTRAPVRREGLRVKQEKTFAEVNLEVIPVTGPAGERDYLVLFENVVAASATRAKRKAAGAARPPKARTAPPGQMESLRRELTATKEFLQSIIEEREAANEELRSANEEILSSNEELQSTSEEMETAKEELQSANEELTTVNEELQHRNVELGQLYNDLNNLFTSVNLPVLMLAGDLRLRRFTPLAADLFNLVSGDVGRLVRDLKPNLDLPNLEELCRRAIDAVATTEQEVRDREGRWYSVRVRPYRTADNQIDGVVVLLLDVTALKAGMNQLAAARDYSEGIVDTIREPLLVLDGALRVRSASRAFYEVFEVPPEETVGKLVYDLGTHQWDIPALRAILSDVVEKNSAFQDFEVEHDFDGLGVRIMLLNARRIDGESQEERLILLAMEDITGRREAEQQREAARVEAETANRTKDEFIAMLSHELRTPLNAMLGWATMLVRGHPEPGMVAKGLAVIERNTRVQAKLIEDLLDISRITSGVLTLELAPVDLGEVIAAALEAVRPAADAKGTRLSLRLDARAGLITGDRDRLQQVVWNLLYNAIKFAPGGTVEVGLDRADAGARITVQDNGMGIPPDALPLIFDRFRQAHGDIARAHGGLGLGLAIVRHIVALHGGMVKAESPGEGQGATFTVDLPLLGGPGARGSSTGESPGVERPTASADGAPRLDGLHVLIVEDESDSSDLLVGLLEGYGARVTAVASVADALAELVQGRPDVIVGDIGMPTEDGYVLIRKVRALPPEHGGMTPAIAVTSFASADDRRQALELGYQAHVAKPFEPALLANVVARLAAPHTKSDARA